jgi:hypothetical protein
LSPTSNWLTAAPGYPTYPRTVTHTWKVISIGWPCLCPYIWQRSLGYRIPIIFMSHESGYLSSICEKNMS